MHYWASKNCFWRTFKSSLDADFRHLNLKRRTEEITGEEDFFWSLGRLNPTNTLGHSNGLYFVLCGGREHHRLHLQNSQQVIDNEKTLSEVHRRYYLETIRVELQGSDPARCFVKLFRSLQLCPTQSNSLPTAHKKTNRNTMPVHKYSITLSKTVARPCKSGGISGFKTSSHQALPVRTRRATNNGESRTQEFGGCVEVQVDF